MLTRLGIQNYALIDNLEIKLRPGFTVITGETGSGKSIILGALQLLSGARFEHSATPRPDCSTVISATFTGTDGSTRVLTREVLPSGRSKATVDGSPVSLTALAGEAGRLFDIHTQGANAVITSPAYQLQLIDSFAGTAEVINAYSDIFRQYVDKRRRLEELRTRARATELNNRQLRTRLADLRDIAPEKGEASRLEARYALLSQSARTIEILTSAADTLTEADGATVSRLRTTAEAIERLPLPDTSLAPRIRSAAIELKDISESLLSYLESITTDPGESERIEERLSRLYAAVKRYALSSPDELSDLLDATENAILSADDDETEIRTLEADTRVIGRRLTESAETLSRMRRDAIPRVEQAILEAARPLGLPNLRVAIELTPHKLTASGRDAASLLVAFNKNQTPAPLSHSASGGEKARLMLAIKTIAPNLQPDTVQIFDEIDTGVSGHIASLMGDMMRGASASRQVIAVTHLPQVAAKGTHHIKVYKEDSSVASHTRIRELEGEDRIREIATMLSGTELTAASLDNAAELLRTDGYTLPHKIQP